MAKRKSKWPWPKRGQYAGLMTARFLGEMVGVAEGTVGQHFRRKLGKEGRKPKDLSPREIAEFVEDLYERRKKRDTDLLSEYMARRL